MQIEFQLISRRCSLPPVREPQISPKKANDGEDYQTDKLRNAHGRSECAGFVDSNGFQNPASDGVQRNQKQKRCAFPMLESVENQQDYQQKQSVERAVKLSWMDGKRSKFVRGIVLPRNAGVVFCLNGYSSFGSGSGS